MYTRKLPYFIVTLFFFLASAVSNAEGLIFRIGSSGTSAAPRYSQNIAQQRIIGPVTSFSHAYGPVPAFGLRNYPQNTNSYLRYRGYRHANHFNSNVPDKAAGKRHSKMYRNPFGFTRYHGSSGGNYQQGYRDGYRDATRSTPKIFNYFGD
jgi:hypothetical protein